MAGATTVVPGSPIPTGAMYDLPSLQGVKKCIVNKDVIEKKESPTLIYQQEQKKDMPA